MDKKISVIVPSFNVEEWIERCVDSICNQTYRNLEIILINDGSDDRTGEIIDEYAKRDERIIAVHQENRGLVLSREKGICMASGDYVTFVDSDDEIIPNMYERLLRNAMEYGADISHCGVCFCFPDGREEHHGKKDEIVIQDNFNGLKDLLEGEFVEPSLCNKLYSAHIVKDSCLDTGVLNNEDLLRNFVLFTRSQKSVYEGFSGYRYMQREGSMSKDKTKLIKTTRHIFKARRLIVDNCSEIIFPYAMRTWISAIVNTVNQLMYSKDPEIKAFCKECRNQLKSEKKNLRYLIPRQRFGAHLILNAPFIHKAIYSVYKLRYEK